MSAHMPISPMTGVSKTAGAAVVDITSQETAWSSLDERLRDSFASTSAATQAEYARIMATANDAKYLSSPGGLFALQVRLGEYKQLVETISAVTRKGVDVATTLLRA